MKPEQNEASTRDSESMAGLDEAREIAAQCWCDTETENIEMDARLAEAFARRLAVWMSDAARSRRDADYYRGLLCIMARDMDLLREKAVAMPELIAMAEAWQSTDGEPATEFVRRLKALARAESAADAKRAEGGAQ